MPDVSCVATVMLYKPGAAPLGAVIVTEIGTAIPAFTEIGFAGETLQVAPASALASQFALIDPA